MNDLRAIISSSLLGTERSPLGRLENTALESARVALENRGSAAQLLGVAMLALNMTRAGGEATTNLITVATAKSDTRAEIPEVVKNRLDDLLNSRKDLIPEWLELIQQKNWRLPHSHLATMLTQAQHTTTLREGVRATLDARGQWLAAQNPDWKWAVGEVNNAETALETWETGAKTARVFALRSIRTEKPAEARALLEQVWKSEVAEERKAFLAELETNISSADEAFFETCLEDRSKEVRSIAATLLARLPDSAFVERMTTRGETILNRGKKKGLISLGTPDLEVTLPEWTADLGRDGIEKKAPYNRGGDKAYWLESIISHIPPKIWEIHLRLEPKEILKRLPKEWKTNIIQSIIIAIQKNPDPDWIEALINHDNKLMENTILMQQFSLEERQRRVRYFIFAKQNKQFYWLQWMNHPWDEQFSQDCLEWLGIIGKQILGGNNEYLSIYQIALHCNPNVVQNWHNKTQYPHWTDFLERAENHPPESKNAWYVTHHLDQIRDLTNILETRAAMRKEILS
jgi:hypothetical protein